MKPTVSPMLTHAFFAFYDTHRPVYLAYAASRLPPEEAHLAVARLFDLLASNWSTVVKAPHPAAWAWKQHTHVVAQRSGHASTPAEDVALLHEQLRLNIDQIATATGTDTATVISLLKATTRSRNRDPGSGRTPQRAHSVK